MDTPATTPAAAPQARPVGTLGRWWNSKTMKRFRRNPLALVGAGLLIGFLLVGLFAPFFTVPDRNCLRDIGVSASTVGDVHNPTKAAFWKLMVAAPVPSSPYYSCYTIPRSSFSPVPQGPGASETLLGTTSGGYDIYYGLIWGARTAFFIGVLVVGFGLIVGIVVGSIAGYVGGWVDNALMRLVDVIFAVPGLVLAMVIVTVLGQNLVNVAISLAVIQWAAYARILRGDILRVKEQEYVASAKALGARGPGIIFKHVLPNSIGSLVIVASLDIGAVVLSAAALSFLGLGAPVGFADWGQMINFARNWILGPPGNPWAYWFVSFWPGLIIVLFVMAWNLLGDAYRDVLDPRSQ